MRILTVSYMHPAISPGGAQQVAYELFKAARLRGHDASLICALETHHEAEFGKPGAPIVPIAGQSGEFLYFPQFYEFANLSIGDRRALRFFRDLVQRLDPEIIHFHHYHRLGVETIRAARVAAPNAIIALTLHEMMAICMADGQMVKRPGRELCHAASPMACNRCFPDLRPEFFMLRAARLQAVLDDCDLFIAPSRFLADRYAAWGLPPAKLHVIANGQVNPAPATETDRRSASLNRFGMFGQMIDNKGLDVLLEALVLLAKDKRVPPAGIVLEINGGNQHYASARYLERIAALTQEVTRVGGDAVEVRQRGPYDRAELADRMRAVDWVIVPSTWWEVFGLVVSEAWMFGRPVIASAIGGLDERVTHDVDGFKVPARDVSALADRIASVVGDEAVWRRIKAGIRAPWSDVEMFDAHLAVWEEIRRSSRPDTVAAPVPNALPTA